MFSRTIGLLGLLFVLALAACRAGPDAGRPELVVSAATSVADTLRLVADEYERREGVRVVLNVGGSDTLATQLLAGARADLFVSADAHQMSRVEAGGQILTSSRVDVLTNQLVVVASPNRSVSVTHVRDLASPGVHRIAMGDPEAVPAGVYAKQYLESLGLWDLVKSKVVPTRNVRAALAAVEAGHVDLGFVYRTDLAVAEQVRPVLEISVADGPLIRYPAAITSDASDEVSARRFLTFLRGREARGLFEEAGFTPLGAVAP